MSNPPAATPPAPVISTDATALASDPPIEIKHSGPISTPAPVAPTAPVGTDQVPTPVVWVGLPRVSGGNQALLPTQAVGVPEALVGAPEGAVETPEAAVDTPRATEATEEGEPPVDTSESAEPEPSVQPKQSGVRRRWVTVFTWIRNIGAVMILFVAWQLWGTAIAQHHAQSVLRNQFQSELAHHHAPTTRSGPTLLAATAHLPQPAEGTVIARLQIPKIGVDQYVVMGTAEGDLAKGPGHYIGTALPGQAGNVAIAGHRTTQGAPFNRLAQLVPGDKIILTTTSGEVLTYLVAQTPAAVSPSDTTVLDDFGDNRITLTTCNPEYSATQRLIVVGELQKSPGLKVGTPKLVTYHVVNPSTASFNVGLLPVVLFEAGILVLLGIFNRRFASWFGRFGQWLILLPVWVAAFYLFFQSLESFLPPSI
jgi:LPXTG-site transpeptidase (sortase) family protein